MAQCAACGQPARHLCSRCGQPVCDQCAGIERRGKPGQAREELAEDAVECFECRFAPLPDLFPW